MSVQSPLSPREQTSIGRDEVVRKVPILLQKSAMSSLPKSLFSRSQIFESSCPQSNRRRINLAHFVGPKPSATLSAKLGRRMASLDQLVSAGEQLDGFCAQIGAMSP